MNMENETKQTKAYSYFVYFLYMQLAHFPHTFSNNYQASLSSVCLQFCLVKVCGKCAQCRKKRPFVHKPNFFKIGLVSVASPPPFPVIFAKSRKNFISWFSARRSRDKVPMHKIKIVEKVHITYVRQNFRLIGWRV